MAGDIKGITIEFRGNATPLQKAIRQVDSELKKTTKELSNVNKALKFNPGNVDLWRQKQQLLKDKINETTDKLKALKAAQKQMDAANVDKNSEQYRKLQREIIETDSQLKHFKSELRSIGSPNLTALSAKFDEMGNKITAAGNKMKMFSAAAAGGLAYAAKQASDYEENMNKVDVAFGSSADSVKEWAKTATAQFGLSRNAALEMTSQFGDMGTSMGLTTEDAATMATSLAGLAGDLSSFKNIGVDEAMTALNGVFTGETESLKRLGVVMTETNLKQFAEDTGLVYSEMTQAEKVQLRYNYVMQQTANAQGDYARTSEGTANSLRTFQATLENLATTMGEYVLPVITPIIQKITEFIQKLAEGNPQLLKIITIIGMVVAVAAPLLMILGGLFSAISTIFGVVSTLIGVIGGIGAAIGPIILIIGALIAIGVLLYKNWDTIKAKAIEFKDSVVQAFNDFKAKVSATFTAIKTAIVTPIQTAIDTIKTIIDKVKSWFPINIGKIFSNLKLPHFKLTGKFSLKDMTVPKLSVDWYAQGGIFDQPTIAGIGESGPEAVVPLDKFWEKMDKIADGAGRTYNFYITGDDPRAIAQEVKRILIQETNRERLAWQ